MVRPSGKWSGRQDLNLRPSSPGRSECCVRSAEKLLRSGSSSQAPSSPTSPRGDPWAPGRPATVRRLVGGVVSTRSLRAWAVRGRRRSRRPLWSRDPCCLAGETPLRARSLQLGPHSVWERFHDGHGAGCVATTALSALQTDQTSARLGRVVERALGMLATHGRRSADERTPATYAATVSEPPQNQFSDSPAHARGGIDATRSWRQPALPARGPAARVWRPR